MGSSLVSGVRSLETISYTPIAHRSPLPIGNLAVESRWNENYHFFFSFLFGRTYGAGPREENRNQLIRRVNFHNPQIFRKERRISLAPLAEHGERRKIKRKETASPHFEIS